MTQETVFRAIWSLLSLAGIIYLLFWPYRNYLIDRFREEMFALRNRLFDEATSGLIPFDHPAYGMLRSTMNGYIRFAHRLTLWHVLFSMLLIDRGANTYQKEISFYKKWESKLVDLDKNTTERLQDYREEMNYLMLKHLLLASPELYPLLFLVVLVVALIGLARQSGSSITSWIKRFFAASPQIQKSVDSLDSTALAYGKMSLS